MPALFTENVHTTKLGLCVGEQGLDLGGFGHVGAVIAHLDARCLTCGQHGSLGGLDIAKSVQNDVGALSSQLFGDPQTDPTGGTGDQGSLSFQHLGPPVGNNKHNEQWPIIRCRFANMSSTSSSSVPVQPVLHHVTCPGASKTDAATHRMAYWAWGDPSNERVLICVHGLSRQGRDFDTLARSLSEHYYVVCPDVVGRGESDWLADPKGVIRCSAMWRTWWRWCNTCVRNVRPVRPSRSIGWAPPWGAHRTGFLDAAARRCLVLACLQVRAQRCRPPTASRCHRPHRRVPGATAALHVRAGCSGLPLEHFNGLWPAHARTVAGLVPPLAAPAADGHGLILHYDPAIAEPFRAVSADSASSGEAALWQIYDGLRCQVLLLRGRDSDLLDAETAQNMTQRGPKAQLVEFAGVGHAQP